MMHKRKILMLPCPSTAAIRRTCANIRLQIRQNMKHKKIRMEPKS